MNDREKRYKSNSYHYITNIPPFRCFFFNPIPIFNLFITFFLFVYMNCSNKRNNKHAEQYE